MYQVFVSSTYKDLVDERNEVMKALLELECIPCGMEYFPAANEDQWSYITSLIDRCDYYIVIVGGRYGSVTEDGISYTEREYRYAIENGVPVIAFIHRSPEDLPMKESEQSPEGRAKLTEFLGLVKQRLCKEWGNPDELGAVVSRSLTQVIKREPKVGWIRGDEATYVEGSAREILELTKKVIELEEELAGCKGKDLVPSEDLAQGAENLLMELTCSVMQYSSEEYVRSSKIGEQRFDIDMSWRKIIGIVLPFVQIPCSESSVKSRLHYTVYEEVMNRHEIDLPVNQYYQKSSLRATCFDVVKVQLQALGFVEVYAEVIEEKEKIKWRLTQKGIQKMYELVAVRREIESDDVFNS